MVYMTVYILDDKKINYMILQGYIATVVLSSFIPNVRFSGISVTCDQAAFFLFAVQ